MAGAIQRKSSMACSASTCSHPCSFFNPLFAASQTFFRATISASSLRPRGVDNRGNSTFHAASAASSHRCAVSNARKPSAARTNFSPYPFSRASSVSVLSADRSSNTAQCPALRRTAASSSCAYGVSSKGISRFSQTEQFSASHAPGSAWLCSFSYSSSTNPTNARSSRPAPRVSAS